MVRFNSGIALILFFLLLLFGQTSLLESIVVSVFGGIAYAMLVFSRKVIAFDSGGVFLEGNYWTENMKERPGMRDFVGKLRKKYRVVLFTNQNALAQQAFNREHSLKKIFDDIVVSGEVGFRKPQKEIYAHLIDRFNVNPNDIVFVDNSAENVEAARGLGINAVLFTSLSGLVSEFRKLNISV